MIVETQTVQKSALKSRLRWLKKQIRLIALMTWRNLQVDFAYKFQLLVDLSWIAIDIAIFTIWGGLIGEAGGDTGLNATTYLLVTVTFWVWLGKAYDDTILALQDEASRGTIGYLVTNNISVNTILIARFVASTVKTTIVTFFILIPILALFGVVDLGSISLQAGIIVLLSFFISWLFMLAFSTLVASLTIVFKRIGALAGMLHAGLKIASGYYFPLSRFLGDDVHPVVRWLIKASFLLPTTQGAEIARRVLGGGNYSVATLLTRLTGLLIGTVFMIVLASLVVYRLTNLSRYWGTLEQY